MGISVDPSQLDTVIKYASFIDLLVHPERMKEILDGIVKATKDYQEVLGVITSKQQVDSFLGIEEKKLQDHKKNLDEQDQKSRASNKIESDRLSEAHKQAERILDTLNKKINSLDERTNAVSAREKEVDSLFSQAERQFKLSEQVKEELNKLEASLKDKQEKLLKIMG